MKQGASATVRWFLCFLCVTVFAWGFQAKISLYKSPTPSHSHAGVKLCQDDQASKQMCGAVVQDGSLHIAISACSGVPRFQARLTFCRDRQVSKAVYASILSYPNALLFRPPPRFKS